MWLSLPNDRKRSTSYNYKTNLQNHVYPAIGNMRVDHIQREDLKLLFDRLLTKGMQSKSFLSIKAPINAILSHGIDSQLIEVNPMRDLKFKHKSSYRVDPLTENEAFFLLEQEKKYDGGLHYAPMLCALRTGMRIGEMQTFTWADLDFENRLITVDKSLKS